MLDLLPGAEDEGIRCNMRVVSLDSDEQYEALSYVWGERGNEEQIAVSGYAIHVTRNMHAALRRLRLPDATRSIWADQLCINQSDTHDKRIQVAMMR